MRLIFVAFPAWLLITGSITTEDSIVSYHRDQSFWSWCDFHEKKYASFSRRNVAWRIPQAVRGDEERLPWLDLQFRCLLNASQIELICISAIHYGLLGDVWPDPYCHAVIEVHWWCALQILRMQQNGVLFCLDAPHVKCESRFQSSRTFAPKISGPSCKASIASAMVSA